jgi:hypothetical protein
LIPDHRLEVAARGESLELAQLLPFVDKVSSLEGRPFSLLFSVLEQSSEELLQFFLSASIVFSWYGASHPEVMQNLHLATSGSVRSFEFFSGQEDCHATAYYLRCLGVRTFRCASISVGEEAQQWLDRYWEGQKWSLTSRTLIIHPGSGGRRKRWQQKGFAQVARWWKGRRGGQVIILLGPAEGHERVQWQNVGDVVDSLSLGQVATLLSRADLYLGNDSGVSHLAGAVGARGAVIFGPTRPHQWRPLGGNLIVVHNTAYRAVFPHVSAISLAEVSPEEVIAKLIAQAG